MTAWASDTYRTASLPKVSIWRVEVYTSSENACLAASGATISVSPKTTTSAETVNIQRIQNAGGFGGSMTGSRGRAWRHCRCRIGGPAITREVMAEGIDRRPVVGENPRVRRGVSYRPARDGQGGCVMGPMRSGERVVAEQEGPQCGIRRAETSGDERRTAGRQPHASVVLDGPARRASRLGGRLHAHPAATRGVPAGRADDARVGARVDVRGGGHLLRRAARRVGRRHGGPHRNLPLPRLLHRHRPLDGGHGHRRAPHRREAR